MPIPGRIGGERALATAINGSPQFLGVIIATTAKDNSNTTTVFPTVAGVATVDQLKGMLLLVQPDTACYIQPQTVAATAVVGSDSSGGGVYVAARERIVFQMLPTEGWLSCIAVTGTTNLKVFQLR